MVSKKIIPLTLILAGLTLISAFLVYQYVRRRQTTAGLKVDSVPPSQIFIDNQRQGVTPLDKLFPPGEVTVKLIPDSTSSGLMPYQQKLNLAAGVYSVIKRDFGPTESQSGGEVITLESHPNQTARLAVVTTLPASASVNIDGQPQGSTPLLVPLIEPGDHQIMVTAPGYLPRTVSAKAVSSFQLNITVQLAAATPTPTLTPPPASPSAVLTPVPTGKTTPTPRLSPTPTPMTTLPKPYVKILSTPTGFLRVRSQPSLAGTELGQVNPGQLFPLLNSQAGWYLIKADLTATSSGWISSQYAQKFE